MLKTQARHVFFFCKIHSNPHSAKKVSAALFLQQRAFLCFMLLSCLSLVDRCDIDQGQLLHICIFQTGYECGCGIQRGQYVDTCLDRVPADDESVFGVLNTLGRSIDDEVDLVAEDQSIRFGDGCSILLVRIALTPFSFRAFAVFLVA